MLSLHSSYKQTRKSTTDYRFNPRTIVTVPLFALKIIEKNDKKIFFMEIICIFKKKVGFTK